MTASLFIGVDIGATVTKVSLVTHRGGILEHQTIPSDLKTPSPTPFLENVNTIITKLIQDNPIAGIGIALCSLINQDHSGAFLSVNAPALNNLDIKDSFESRFGMPVRVINDVNAFALAEYNIGSGRGAQRILCLALGTGLAISVIVQGEVIKIWGGVAADAARIILDPDSTRYCNAGVRGSAEALCGTAYIEDRARELYGREDIRAFEVITSAKEGSDPIANQIITEVGRSAGHLLALLSPIFFPQRIMITGGTAQAGDRLLSAIRHRHQAMIGAYHEELTFLETGDQQKTIEIVKGTLGPDAATIGAVLNLISDI